MTRMTLAITFGRDSSAYVVNGGIELTGLVTTPDDDCTDMVVTVPDAVLSAAGLTTADVLELVRANERYIRFESEGPDGRTAAAGSDGSKQVPAIVATRVLATPGGSYCIVPDEHRWIVANALTNGQRTLSDDQATLIARMLGAQVRMDRPQANATVSTFA